MGVRKYRSVEEFPPPAQLPTVLASIDSACALGSLSRGLGDRPVAPRGVRKFRSVAEADAHRAEWEGARDQSKVPSENEA